MHMKIQKQISQNAYRTDDSFLGRYQKLIKQEVIPYQYQVLCDQAEGAEKSHVIANFINAGKALRGEDVGDGCYGMVFQDSDAAKWLEAAAYSLTIFPDKELEETADQLIELIARAQDEDGYLNTYFTIKDRDKRWTNLLEGHELYCDSFNNGTIHTGFLNFLTQKQQWLLIQIRCILQKCSFYIFFKRFIGFNLL